MIAAAGDPVSPHASTTKNALPTTAFPGASMDDTDAVAVKQEDRSDDDSEVSDRSALGEEEEDNDDDRRSDEFNLLTLNSSDHEHNAQSTGTDTKPSISTTKAAAAATATTAATSDAPVKRILRRKRKRMSEDERRVRHREVQRQFMKRKRARLGEMRKVLRGLEAHHRLVQAMDERTKLEKQNAELTERLAAPGSGWEWDDAPPPQHHEEKHPSTAPPPHIVYLVPDHGHLTFHHQAPPPQFLPHMPHMPLHWHYPPTQYAPPTILHGHPADLQHPPSSFSTSHTTAHRPAAPGVTLPWDDILDAVTGESVDISF